MLEVKPQQADLTPVPDELKEEAAAALGDKPMVKVASDSNLGKWAAAQREAQMRKERKKRNKVQRNSRKKNRR